MIYTRHCTNCGEEFRPGILRCSDCGGDLEDRYEEEEGEGSPLEEVETGAPVAPEPPPADQPVFYSPDSKSLKESADRLAGAGIAFRATGSGAGFQLLVRSEDLAKAGVALAGREGSLAARDDTQPDVGAEGGGCPACGAKVQAGVLECPECGLVVGAEAAQCHACGSSLGPADVQCPVCHPSGD
jgi:hypothetical protein